MKTTTTLLLIFIALLLLQSCSPEDPEPQLKPVSTTIDYTDAMMQRDSISKDGEETDPPTKPIIVIIKP
ncbi:hypothetical protein FSS13T_26370 [Flavobacterium saliperosum S13]|uniref:Uncharacterized protein n=2 Tax=Flavobacterium saliperosum TaxID=329186 RepID=A0A1G4W4L4_9FLAO|nr:hypothetical protein [Flavobacterium saliperosum]ESU21481.1 hypothetical protein FSS13T_26370 [Flavobacterium saliperosum S13]SCX16651.1 hypothetical protein SAMN02927925_02396 [Flavobacterium saliperosum]